MRALSTLVGAVQMCRTPAESSQAKSSKRKRGPWIKADGASALDRMMFVVVNVSCFCHSSLHNASPTSFTKSESLWHWNIPQELSGLAFLPLRDSGSHLKESFSQLAVQLVPLCLLHPGSDLQLSLKFTMER